MLERLDPARLGQAFDLLRDEVRSDFLPAASASVCFRGAIVASFHAGHRDPGTRLRPVDATTQYLIASLTKPVVCAAAMLLVEEGRFSIDEPVSRYLPELSGHEKDGILIRHLLTHTSGLPDQLPEGAALRRRQASRAELVQAVYACTPLFPPGHGIHYQSMGILLLAEIMERVTGSPVARLLEERLFRPLGMERSALGMPPGGLDATASVLPPSFEPGSPDYGDDWNGEYWRSFGSPWGGLHSTADDLGRFLLHMLGDRDGPLSTSTRAEMRRCQTDLLPEIPEAQRKAQRWGLGWMLGSRRFGTKVSADTFGHIGATGTLCWGDPATGLATVLLTTQPRICSDASGPVRDVYGIYSDAVAAAVS
jgi:CubicO group peptidase (beta-lactamase class C family)